MLLPREPGSRPTRRRDRAAASASGAWRRPPVDACGATGSASCRPERRARRSSCRPCRHVAAFGARVDAAPRRVGVRVMEDVERSLAGTNLDPEALAGLLVGDSHEDLIVALAPQQPDVEPIVAAMVEFAKRSAQIHAPILK